MKNPWTILCVILLGIGNPLLAGSSNFDGAGADDLSVYDPASGNWYILSLDGTVLAHTLNWGWNEAVPATWNYDANPTHQATDLAVYVQKSGKWYIYSSDTGGLIVAGTQWGGGSLVSVPGDYNGDGVGDLAVYDPGNGNWYILSLNGALLAFGENWGGEGMVPVTGDYNGDGASDLAVYHRATGNWYIRTLWGELILFEQNWGNGSMYPVPGDYDGDGKDDMAVYDQQDGKWYIRTVAGGLILMGETWGWSMAQPVSGDYNGDGKDDLAVYHRATGNWYIRTTDGTLVLFELGWGIPHATTPSQAYVNRSTAGASIICFGDSITYGRGSLTNGPATGYPTLLEKKLNQHFGGLFRCLNSGVPGERTYQGLARLPSVLNEASHAKMFLLMQGTNDALTDEIFQSGDNNLRDMLSLAAQRGLKTFLSTIPPVVPSTSDRAEQASRINRFNGFIPGIAQPTLSRLVETYSYLASLPNWTSYFADVNHPNDAGYQVVRDAFFDAIDQAYRTGYLP